MTRLLEQVGHQEYLYETFVDITEETFGQVIEAIQKGFPDESFLVDIFNDFSQSMSIITHFRVSLHYPADLNVRLILLDLNSFLPEPG
jgi:ubiquitin thioesterase protein OTUB1